ncbi:MAG TPA: efflux RND transporter periplasmic adaptor subunit [Verrucomicrobiae bacterium]|jgi:cobalt-zinc-cadmium efflux system membrane fusion protein|nr:efflux RND transporter periplasmic adaptor subunit [Verrucomicrobiae bacterium]
MKIKSYAIFVPVVAIAFAAIVAGCSRTSETAEPSAPASTNVTLTAAQRQRVQLQTVKSSKFHRTIDTSGTVGFDNDQATTIIAPISGPVAKILVSLGAEVKAGDPLALVDSPDFATAISGYRKALATSTNTRRIADLDEDLFKHGALARSALEQAQTDAVNADADTEAALQQVHALGVNDRAIEDLRKHVISTNLPAAIRSPLDGTLVERLVSPGQLLQAGTTPCFTVADLSQMWVMPNIFESDLSYVAVGDPAEIITSADPQKILGAVDNISAIVDPNTRSIGVRVVVKNPGGVLKKQMYVRVLIHSSRESTGLLVPVSSVLRNDENLPFVYLAGADGSFSRRRVILGSRVNDDYEITSGLAEGDQVVTDGGLFVQFLQNQ